MEGEVIQQFSALDGPWRPAPLALDRARVTPRTFASDGQRRLAELALGAALQLWGSPDDRTLAFTVTGLMPGHDLGHDEVVVNLTLDSADERVPKHVDVAINPERMAVNWAMIALSDW
jgi:hypothetical protein